MRELKFRVFDKKEGMIIFPHKTKDLVFTDKGPNILCFHRGIPLPLIDTALIVQQYTGLKDKNGVEIYEGDIVKTVPDGWILGVEGVEFVSSVIFERGMFCVKMPSHIGDYQLKIAAVAVREVIGNIYENPELLGGL